MTDLPDVDVPPTSLGHNSASYAEDLDPGDALSEIPTDDKLARLRDLAKDQLQHEREITRLEMLLAAEKTKLAGIAEKELPALMNELKFKVIPLTNGGKLTLKSKTVAYIKVENQQLFYEWMNKHGYGTLVKREVSTTFPRGDSTKAAKLLGYLKRWYKDFPVQDKESIHGTTLNAWARELQEQNDKAIETGIGKIVEPPPELKITQLETTVITLPKGVTDL